MKHESSEKAAVLAKIAKRRNIYLLLFFVFLFITGIGGFIHDYVAYAGAVLTGIFSGFAMICNANHKYIATDGRKKGCFWNIPLCLFGFIVIPWIVAFIFSRITPIASKIVGVKAQ